jgi:hypothetical protein
MGQCVCGESLTGKKKICSGCQKRNKLARKKELRRSQSVSLSLLSTTNTARRKLTTLMEPISDDKQQEIDAAIDRTAEKRLNLNPLDPRAIATIRPAIWLWQ